MPALGDEDIGGLAVDVQKLIGDKSNLTADILTFAFFNWKAVKFTPVPAIVYNGEELSAIHREVAVGAHS